MRRLGNEKDVVELLLHQNYQCNSCKLNFESTKDFQCDHVIPFSVGGKTNLNNLQLLCLNCHKEKTKRDMLAKKTKVEIPQNIYNNLRKLQKKYADAVIEKPSVKTCVVHAPGGTGKTVIGALGYNIKKQQGIVNRLLIVAANSSQKNQWKSCKKDLKLAGLNNKIKIHDYRYVVDCTEDGMKNAILHNHNDKLEIYVTTIQKLIHAKEHFYELLSKNHWMICSDEAHHYAEHNEWGKALDDLPCEYHLALTATPVRKQGSYIFENKKEKQVINYSMEEALENNDIRKFEIYGVYDFNVIYRHKRTDDKFECKLSDLANKTENGERLDNWENKNNLRATEEFNHAMLADSIYLLRKLNQKHPNQHQAIVHCPSVNVAKAVEKQIKNLNTEFSVTSVSYEDGNAQKKIKDFQDGKWNILCHVNMFSEGCDNVKASVCLYLGVLKTSPQLIQAASRHSRRNLNIPAAEDKCYAIVPADSPARECFEILASSKLPDVDNKPFISFIEKDYWDWGGGEGGEGGGNKLNPFEIENVTYCLKQEYIKRWKSRIPDLEDSVFAKEFDEFFNASRGIEPKTTFVENKKFDENLNLDDIEEKEEEKDEARKKYNTLSRSIVFYLLRHDDDNDNFGKLIKIITGYFNKKFGTSISKNDKKNRLPSASLEELHTRNMLLEQLQEKIKEEELTSNFILSLDRDCQNRLLSELL